MTAHYTNLGVEFLYPENWEIIEEDAVSWPRTVSLQSPDGGFWALMIYRGGDKGPVDLMEEVLSTMQQEYEELESSKVCEQFNHVHMNGYDMCFYCLDFVVSARALGVCLGDQTLLTIWQAEDREFGRLEQVFRAITTSLLEHC